MAMSDLRARVAFGGMVLSLMLGSIQVRADQGDDAIWAGYKAKLVCSGVFVSGRKLADVLKYDVAEWDYPTQVDSARQQVEVLWKGEGIRAVYRGPRLGCTLLPNIPPNKKGVRNFSEKAPNSAAPQKINRRNSPKPWPEGDADVVSSLTATTDAQIKAFLKKEFSEEDPKHPKRNTRAIVIVHKGRIIGERYAERIGIHRDTPLIGWSLTKSITNALSGILIGEKKLKLDAPIGFANWRGDERQEITLDNLLRMGSGLDFHEDDTTERVSDVTRMLFVNADATEYMLNRRLAHAPGTKFNYSTGDSILISAAMRSLFRTDEEYTAFPWRALFDKIGMTSAVFEKDAAGTFLGGTNLFATARDWARFGLLFHRDGMWNQMRVLPEGWVDYSRKTTAFAARENKYYGAHFWLVDPVLAREKGIPLDTYLAAGFKGQAIFIIPSMDLVMVRMGWTDDADYKPYDILEGLSQLKIEYRQKTPSLR